MQKQMVDRPAVNEGAVGILAEALARAVAQDGADGVILSTYLRHLYGGPDPEVAHEVGMRHIRELNALLSARRLPPVCYDEHCFRFVS
ncbi:MAG TPA: hypothetical protein VD978_01670 [Azospirillum sp.]|nr:hypothetical protein [Azospirillum sp.]